MDKMREEFEDWCKVIGFTLKPNAFGNGDYAMGYGLEEWNAWKASRAAMCVELPAEEVRGNFCDIYESGYINGYNSALFDVRQHLDHTGVSYK